MKRGKIEAGVVRAHMRYTADSFARQRERNRRSTLLISNPGYLVLAGQILHASLLSKWMVDKRGKSLSQMKCEVFRVRSNIGCKNSFFLFSLVQKLRASQKLSKVQQLVENVSKCRNCWNCIVIEKRRCEPKRDGVDTPGPRETRARLPEMCGLVIQNVEISHRLKARNGRDNKIRNPHTAPLAGNHVHQSGICDLESQQSDFFSLRVPDQKA